MPAGDPAGIKGDERGWSPPSGRRLPGGREHVGLRTVRLGGEARRSAARRDLAVAMAGAFAALQPIYRLTPGKSRRHELFFEPRPY